MLDRLPFGPAELELQSPDAFALHQRTTARSLHAPNVESLEALVVFCCAVVCLGGDQGVFCAQIRLGEP